jgi:aldose 1-epimerase
MEHEQLSVAGGFDHNWILNPSSRPGLTPAARLYDPRSGRQLDIATTEPGLQFYDGHSLGRGSTDGGGALGPFAGLCLETQHYPDSPNQPAFPSTVVRPGESYRSKTSWRLSVA